MNNDAELLCRYADEGSQAAFTELVQRHVNLVYGAALRRTGGDPHRAADVAQHVFTTLARDARKLSHHAILPAWLHTATRNAALNLMIAEKRRQTREAEALALEAATATDGSNPDWDRLRPLLDAAIDELPEADRTAVILRFLEQRPFAEIAAALQVSEDAARMRTDRALEKLRPALARHGITSTAAALGAIMLAQPVVAAPSGLATTVSTHAMAAAATGALATFMNTKTITAVVISAIVAFGTGSYVGLKRASAAAQASSLEMADQSRVLALLREENGKLKAEAERRKADADQMNADLAQLADINARLKAQIRPVVTPKNPTLGLEKWEMQRTILSSLRQIDAARKQYKLEHGAAPDSISALVGRGKFIKTVRTVGGEDYSALPMEEGTAMTVTTPDGLTVTFDPKGLNGTKPEVPPEVARIEQLQSKAVAAYQAAHNGSLPTNAAALLAYFPTPEDAADFADYIGMPKMPAAKKP